MTRAYFNEIDPYAAQWLRNLVDAGHLPSGDVDTRSIVDVRPSDLAGYAQCHFFAGIGGWPHAARLAGWPDDRPLWTGSCPCQPFSVAGKQLGAEDPRHLWPHFFRLIRALRPPVVMGEQVAGAAGYGWLDGVVADLAGEDYACRGVDIPACSVDAPHIRSRLYWVAQAVDDAAGARRAGAPGSGPLGAARDEAWRQGPAGRGGDGGGMGDPSRQGLEERERNAGVPGAALGASARQDATHAGQRDDVADADPAGRGQHPQFDRRAHEALDGTPGRHAAGRGDEGRLEHDDVPGREHREEGDARGREHGEGQSTGRAAGIAGGRNGTFWSDAVWLTGADGKARRAQPGLPLLAHGVSARVGRLRAYGNAIVAPLAAEVIAAFMEAA